MSKKLLLADDSITIQKVIQITFAHEDYELTITDNGDAAMAKAQEISPDLVMADVYMPGKNGYELASAIKHDPALQHVPVLLLAGSFEPFDEDKARSCKADAWIEKPFESQNLIDKVAELLSAAKAAPQVAAPAPQPVAATAPAAAFDEMPLADFDEPAAVPEPAMAAPVEDPFGDISFEDEAPVAEPEPLAAADDWSDVDLEPAAPMSVDEPFAGAGEPAFETTEDFSFGEEEPVAAAALEKDMTAPADDLDVFDMGEDEIMPLGDDDILGAEDLEPAMEEQTLVPWSRTEVEGSDVFAESLAEEPFAEEPAFETTDEPAVFAEEQSAFAEEPAEFVEADSPFTEEPAAFDLAAAESELVVPAQAAVVAAPAAQPAIAEEVEAKVTAMTEDELERIIEKVVTKVVEKLAGSILEQVAWEVVPDLAENLIREEIRKIKDAAA